MRDRIILGIFAALFTLLFAPGADIRAQEGDIVAMGSARIAKTDKGNARDAAIDQALEKGLESYLLRKLGPRGFADNLPRIITSVIPGARECTSTYHVMAEHRAQETLTVLVSMKVNGLIADARLKEAQVSTGAALNEKVLLLLTETDEEKGVSFHWWGSSSEAVSALEASLYAALQERGLAGANRINVPADLSGDMTRAELSDADVIKWGRILSADIVVSGGLRRSGRLRKILFRVFDTASGEAVSEEIKLEDESGDEGLIARVADKIAAAASGRKAAAQASQGVNVIFEGVSDASQIQMISRFLKKDLPSVKTVTPSRLTVGSAAFRLVFAGRLESLTTQLLQTMPYRAELLRGNDKEVVLRLLGPR